MNIKKNIDQILREDQATDATEYTATETKEDTKATTVIPEGEFVETREKMTNMRKIIAKAMVNSKTKAPHVTLLDDVDVTELVAHRRKFKEIAAEQDVKLTYLPYVVKALVSALRSEERRE